MFSKIKVALFSVLLVAIAFGGFTVALAASSTPGNSDLAAAATTPAAPTPNAPTAAITPGTHWMGGHITALGADSLTVTGPKGGAHVVSVTDQTKYFNHDAQTATFASLQVGDRVLGAANVGSDGKATALLIIDFGAQTQYRGIGAATVVNAGEQSFTFVNRRGQVWDFYTDPSTKITDRKGNVKTFSDIQVGTRLFVHAEKRADGKWWALNITVGKTVQPATTSTPSSNNS